MRTSSNPHSRLTAAALSVVAALGLLAFAGCGDDDDEPATTEPAATTGATGAAGGAETVAVSETDYKIDPANPTVKAGDVTFEVTNDGEIAHNLEIEGPSGEEELETDLQAGDSDTLQVDLSEPGTYEWYCPIANHRELGMEGEVTVE